MIPGSPDWNRSARSFGGSDESHRKWMWISRVIPFFKCNFRAQELQDSPILCVLARVSRLRELQRQMLVSLHTHHIWLETGTEHSEF